MSVLHLGIRAKFIIILLIAAVLPLAIGIAAIWVLGYRGFKRDRGVLAGATGKTFDYWQADQAWWQNAFALGPGQAQLEGVHYDESARVHSIDVAIPIFDQSTPPRPVGVIKGVLNASPLFFSVEPIPDVAEPDRHLVLGDGRILISLF